MFSLYSLELYLTVALFCFVLASHTISDFYFQTDWMAKNKSTSNEILAIHVGVYSMCMFVFIGSLAVFSTVSFLTVLYFVLINALAHFVTDYITSRLTSYYWKQEKRHEFFVVIGFDQLAHNVVLLFTFAWLFLT